MTLTRKRKWRTPWKRKNMMSESCDPRRPPPSFTLIPSSLTPHPGRRTMMSTVMTMMSAGRCGGRLPSVWQPRWAPDRKCSQNSTVPCLPTSLPGLKVCCCLNYLFVCVYVSVSMFVIYSSRERGECQGGHILRLPCAVEPYQAVHSPCGRGRCNGGC